MWNPWLDGFPVKQSGLPLLPLIVGYNQYKIVDGVKFVVVLFLGQIVTIRSHLGLTVSTTMEIIVH